MLLYVTIRSILIISLYIIKLALIFFLFLIYFYCCDIMTCLLLFQLHKCFEIRKNNCENIQKQDKSPSQQTSKVQKMKM